MQCHKCGFDSPVGMKFCGQCATPLNNICSHCEFENPPEFKFCGNCGYTLISTPSSAQPTGVFTNAQPAHKTFLNKAFDKPKQDVDSIDAQTIASHSKAERRQITVLFCDLVGSSALSEDIDPEELRDIMSDYRDTCSDVVEHFGGHVAQYLGDGILVYFGYPTANEDDSTRAVQTGLEIIRKLSVLNKRLLNEMGISLAVRVGIHTGLVVVGEIGGGDKRSLALGTTPNIAARLQDLALPNTVVISAATQRLVHKHFETKSIGEHNLKGFSQPLALYKVDSAYEAHLHIEPRRHRSTAPMIGREQESALIRDRLEQAKMRDGQVVLLSGEAGIGKSRLAQYVRDTIDASDYTILEGWGSPYHKNSYLHCVLGVFRRMLNLDENNISDDEKLKRLEIPLAAYGIPLAENVPLLANLFGIQITGNRYPEPQLTPKQRKQKVLSALVGLVLGAAMQRMVVVIIEDLHWVDPTTIELLSMLIDQAPTAHMFVLLTYRLEFVSPWPAKSHVTQISINRLTRAQSGRMVKHLANDKHLPVAVFNEIINKTDGTPIFVEELTKMVLESDLLKETHEHYELAAPLSSLSIPSTLHDSLMARLDRLGEKKELAQLSATLGREFTHLLLIAVAEEVKGDLNAGIEYLVKSELFYQRGLPPQASYTFRHALMHEVAYQSLLKRTRQQYHLRVSRVLLNRFPNLIQGNPEIMAHHCNEAGQIEEAIQFWLQAGKLAIQRAAIADAIVHLSLGLAAIDRIKENPSSNEYELKLQATIGLAYMLCKGYAAAEVQQAYNRAYAISRNIGDTNKTFSILCGLWEFYVVRSDLKMAVELAEQLSTSASQTSNDNYVQEARRAIGATNFWKGELAEAKKYLERTIDVENTSGRPSQSFQEYNSQDTEVATLANAACVTWLLGYPDQALETIKQAYTLSQTLKDPFTSAYAEYFMSIVHQLRGEAPDTFKHSKQALEIGNKYEFSFWQATASMLNCWANNRINPSQKNAVRFNAALEGYLKTGSRLALTYFYSLLADIYIVLKNYQQADEIVDKALEFVESQGERFFEVELLRLKGVIAQQQKQNESAKEFFEKALDVAKRTSSMSLELRATASFAGYLQSKNQVEQGRKILSKIVNQFSEGFSSPEWQNADALLTQLMEQQQQSPETL